MNEADAQLLMRFYDAECTPAEEDAAGELIRTHPAAADWLAELGAQQERWETLPPALSEVEVEADWQALKTRLAEEEGAVFGKPSKGGLAWTNYATTAAAAAVVLLASVAFLLPRHEAPSAPVTPNIVESVETDIEGATPIIFVDQQSGWSVVWVDESAAG